MLLLLTLTTYYVYVGIIRKVSALNTEILEQVICCLYNIVLDCNANMSLLLKFGGRCVLAEIPVKQLSQSVHECLVKLIKMLPTNK